jgi:ankyrin repeat protein
LTIINLLIQNNANINAQKNEGKTALMMVCQKCNPRDDRDDFIFRICDTFITNRNIDLTIIDENNKTAMDYANENCNQNIKDLFLRHQYQDQPIDQPINQPIDQHTNLQGGRRRSTRAKKYRRKTKRKSNKKSKRKYRRK